MKRAERQHLRDNPVADFVADLRDLTIGRSRQALLTVPVIVIVSVAAAGYFFWQSRRAAKADALLGAAMTVAETPVVPPAPGATQNPPASGATSYPSDQARLEAVLPKYLEVVEAYPSSNAATAAIYRAAGALSALGRLSEAEQRYQDVIARDGNGIYGQMAQLGLADAHLSGGHYDNAIEIYRNLSTAADTRLPLDAILMQLGRAYAKAGKMDEAARTYSRVVDEFPQSLYAADARNALNAIKKS